MNLQNIIIAAIAGGVAGTVRTWMTHGLKLVQPKVTVRDHEFSIKLGFIASALLGAILAVLAVEGIVLFAPLGTPQNIYDVILLAAGTGFSSLSIINHWYKEDLPDIDTESFTLEFKEINEQKAMFIKRIMKDLDCVERIQIRDGKYAGVVEVIIVPKPELDREQCKQSVEKFVKKYRPIGTQVYVKLPEEVNIDVELTALVLDVDDDRTPNDYETEIEDRIRNYIDSLLPGERVQKSHIVSRAIAGFRFVKDVPGDSIITNPPLENNAIMINEFQVARSGDIQVNIETVLPT